MYIVMEASACMPASCRSPYRHLAVVEIDQYHTARDLRPKMLSDRAQGVLRIVRRWGPVPAAGKTPRSGIVQARTQAKEMASMLNNSRDAATAEDIIGAGGSA